MPPGHGMVVAHGLAHCSFAYQQKTGMRLARQNLLMEREASEDILLPEGLLAVDGYWKRVGQSMILCACSHHAPVGNST